MGFQTRNDKQRWYWLCSVIVFLFLLAPILALADTSAAHGGHTSPVLAELFALTIILLAAKLGGDVMVRLGQPEVLGELCVGIVLGNLRLLGIEDFPL
jgi:hypothetical protein